MTKILATQRRSLAHLGIYSAHDVSTWARRRGLLTAFITYTPASQVLPAHWQVIWPGHRTSTSGPAWQRGHKTFVVRSVTEKNRAEQAARTFAEVKFDVPTWVRIEGLGGDLFPAAVAEELKAYVPGLAFSDRRQHA